MLRIQLDQDGLNEAIRSHLVNMGLSLEGKNVEVNIIAGRSKGDSADITITDGVVDPIQLDEAVESTETAATTAEDAEPVAEPEEKTKKSGFGKKAKVAEDAKA